MKLYSDNHSEVIEHTRTILNNGGLVIAPSDTVYGLLVDATNDQAVKKLITFKNRPIGKAISVFLTNFPSIESYTQVDKQQLNILRQLLPGPFTVVLPSLHKVSSLLEAENGSLGIRLPDYPFINKLCMQFGKPITATSANLAGRSPHYEISSLLKQLPQFKQDLIDLIIDAGKLPRNKPSTVVDLTKGSLKILRKGDVMFTNEKTYISHSPIQTKKIAQFIFNKQKDTDKPLVFLLKGDLGAGKTVFIKGIGEIFGIKNIISPTFTISYEYDFKESDGFNKLYHFDLYNIEDAEELKHIGLEQSLTKGNIICIEWGEKAGDLKNLLLKNSQLIFIEIKYKDEHMREIGIGA